MPRLSELVTVIPGRGIVTLYRAKTLDKVKSYQRHNELFTFEGKKVSATEVTGEYIDSKLGWVYEAVTVGRGITYVQ